MAEDLDARQDPVLPRLQRMLDNGPVLPPRDPGHELAPYIKPPEGSIGDQLADKAISIMRQTGQHVLDQFKPMHEQLEQAEQMVITAMADGEENIRAQLRIFEAAAKIIQQVDVQLRDAVKPLVALTNGK